MRMNQIIQCTEEARLALLRIAGIAVVTLPLLIAVACGPSGTDADLSKNASAPAPQPATPSQPAPAAQSGEPELTTMEVNKAVMVTEELDLGKPVPADAPPRESIEVRSLAFFPPL